MQPSTSCYHLAALPEEDVLLCYGHDALETRPSKVPSKRYCASNTGKIEQQFIVLGQKKKAAALNGFLLVTFRFPTKSRTILWDTIKKAPPSSGRRRNKHQSFFVEGSYSPQSCVRN